MSARKLREWRGVKAVAAPSGVAITTRLRTTPADDFVLNLVADHLGRLRRADLAAVSSPSPPGPGLDADGRKQDRKDRLNSRKRALTAQSSSRWASAIIKGNDKQCQLARRNQERHAASLRAAISAIESRLDGDPRYDPKLIREARKEHEAARKKALLSGAPDPDALARSHGIAEQALAHNAEELAWVRHHPSVTHLEPRHEPQWTVPAVCPECGARVDQFTGSKAADPRCEYCQNPLPRVRVE